VFAMGYLMDIMRTIFSYHQSMPKLSFNFPKSEISSLKESQNLSKIEKEV
jgi:hypothetical protein